MFKLKKASAPLIWTGVLILGATLGLLGCDNNSSGSSPFVCGDGVCNGNEDGTTCPEDCYCGNDVCEEDETPTDCSEDCAVCGDGECHEPAEDCGTCAEDCGECAVCGNGLIEGDEECDATDLGGQTCADAGFSGGDLACTEECLLDTTSCFNTECGNGICEDGEDSTNCPDDCAESCGDGMCEALEGETCGNCPNDCTCGESYCQDFLTCVYECTDMACAESCHEDGCLEAQDNSVLILGCIEENCSTECVDPSAEGCHTCTVTNCGAFLASCYQSVCPGTCGDGVCDGNEDHATCPEDCSECGNDICEADETAGSCPDDCLVGCGDDTCDETETCESCPADCGSCPMTCGDGDCDPVMGESCATCPADCTCGTATCSEILDCLNNCGQDQTCVNSCFETGCYEAQQQAQAFYSCMLTNCAAECGTDPEGQTCMQCMAIACGAEAQACYNGTCS